jgi:hypothetical protein
MRKEITVLRNVSKKNQSLGLQVSLAKGQELACKMKEGWVWEQMFLMLQEMKM